MLNTILSNIKQLNINPAEISLQVILNLLLVIATTMEVNCSQSEMSLGEREGSNHLRKDTERRKTVFQRSQMELL